MKACIIQPEYSVDYSRVDELFEKELELLARCDSTTDIIVMPELADVPTLAPTRELSSEATERYRDRLLTACRDTALRCDAIVFVNARWVTDEGYRNTTYAIDRRGEIVGQYHKQHLTPGEVHKLRLDSDYSFEHTAPTVVEIDGLRFAFLTCYDFYFYEMIPNIARERVDFIIGCSHQRSDTHAALEIMTRHLAYNTNAYVLRSSVSMGESSALGGASMIVSPTGEVLANLYSKVGIATAEFDPHNKYYKPAGFGNPPAAHYEYVEQGRRPWKYRPAGSAVVRPDALMKYPRVCAHRGFNSIAPENSMPAFGAAVAMGAEEIEFDVWFTKDGVPVSIHDSTLDRVSNGTGNVWDHTLDELLKLDFGSKHEAEFSGLRIPTLEQILKKFACHTVMNIHLKTMGDRPEYLDGVVKLIYKYDCEKYVYFMSGDPDVLERLMNEYPDITRCAGAGKDPYGIVDKALKYKCKKVQLYLDNFDQAMIDRAHEAGIVCNVFYSDDPDKTERYLDMGIDVILTNDYNRCARVVAKREKYIYY